MKVMHLDVNEILNALSFLSIVLFKLIFINFEIYIGFFF